MGKVLCTNCNTILESLFRHDYQSCGCSNQTFVDGGNDYLRYGGMDLRFVEVFDEKPIDILEDIKVVNKKS